MAKKKSSKKKKKFKFFRSIAKGIYYVLSAIYGVLDKIIITPVAKIMLLVQKPFKGSSKRLDRVLNNKIMLIIFSLAIALLYFFVVDNAAQSMMNNSTDIISNQKVKALYNEEAYVVEGLPETVDITLIGGKSALYLAKQSSNQEVVIDLRDLKPGTHKVNLKYNKSAVSSVEYKLDPSSATVVIYEKTSKSKKITKELLNEDKMDSKYTISNIKFSRDEVYVKGPEYKLKQIAIVKALVDVSKISNPTVGTTTLKEIPLVAYDVNGQKLDVEIVPETIDATIEINSPSKEVPLKVIPEGKVVFGKAIDEVTLSQTKAIIYSDSETLEKISYIPVNINVDGISKTTEYTVNLSLPSGVNEMSVKSVVAKVTLGDVEEKTIKNVNISIKNLEDKKYTAQALSKTDSVATVIVKGTKNNLKDIDVENINAYVDLQGKTAGTYKVPVKVNGDDLKLTYTPKTEEITIIIKEINS